MKRIHMLRQMLTESLHKHGGIQPPDSNGSAFSLETHGHPFTFDNHGYFRWPLESVSIFSNAWGSSITLTYSTDLFLLA
jgi:hypothetical protein